MMRRQSCGASRSRSPCPLAHMRNCHRGHGPDLRGSIPLEIGLPSEDRVYRLPSTVTTIGTKHPPGHSPLRPHGGTLVATICALALRIGANASIVSVVQSVLLNPLPHAQRELLMLLGPRWRWSDALSLSVAASSIARGKPSNGSRPGGCIGIARRAWASAEAARPLAESGEGSDIRSPGSARTDLNTPWPETTTGASRRPLFADVCAIRRGWGWACRR